MVKRLFVLDDIAGIFLSKNIQPIIRKELNLSGYTFRGIRDYIRSGETGRLKFFFCSIETMQDLLAK
jgi:hypothetical protein